MNKKAIWLIIGLMSAAVLGVILVQIDLIRTSMSVNEERFNKNVQEALVKVSDRLEDFEETYFIESVNGFTLAYQEQQIIGSNAQQNNSSKNFKPEDWDRMPNADRQFYVKIMMDNPG
ncbi:MAG: hypothetical protein IPO07_03280 [Haliscomenobacter sp.]|nr:hypothetical protein [Haliscomenobacter sp.]MBK9487910.1 hypothetical protein [Haliscomenobacter sp.]